VLARDFLEQSARRFPQKVALVHAGRRLTYATLESQSNRLAQALLAHGIGRGDRVAIHLPNCPEAVIAIFAALKAGAAFVPINPAVKADKLNYILDQCRPAAFVTQPHKTAPARTEGLLLVVHCAPADEVLAPVMAPQSHTGTVSLNWNEISDSFPDQAPPASNIDSDLACLIYTSGSTGRPKGVMSEQRNVVFASGSIIQYLRNTDSDVVINALPLSFDYGLYQLLMTFRFGGTLVLENSLAFPSLILRRIAEERVTGLPGVPTLFSLLLSQDLNAFDLSSLRYLTNTAAALPSGQIAELRRCFPQARLYSMYGLTETKRTLYLPPEELDRRPDSVGIPIPGTEAWIEDAEGRRLGPGQIGELVVRGPHVMAGYWNDPQATDQRFRFGLNPEDRICYSGDLFHQDNEGFFYFVARKDDIIKSRGEKVAPKEVESVLCMLPGVIEAAVIGVPDPLLGQAIKAFLVCRGAPLPARQVLAHCRTHLEEFMVPREIEYRDSLPHNHSGKIDKPALTKCVMSSV
jgi:long-chain acyl-CoA synthetase